MDRYLPVIQYQVVRRIFTHGGLQGHAWQIPLSSFAGVNLKAVKKMILVVGDKAKPAPDGARVLYLDDIGFGHPAAK